jgi:hypothetical protein
MHVFLKRTYVLASQLLSRFQEITPMDRALEKVANPDGQELFG